MGAVEEDLQRMTMGLLGFAEVGFAQGLGDFCQCLPQLQLGNHRLVIGLPVFPAHVFRFGLVEENDHGNKGQIGDKDAADNYGCLTFHAVIPFYCSTWVHSRARRLTLY